MELVVEVKQTHKAEFERQLDWHKRGGSCFLWNKGSGSNFKPASGSQPEPELELESSSESE